MSGARAQQAREHHKASLSAQEQAAQHRAQRDVLVRSLRRDDPGTWSYTTLARAVGCSPELIAVIVKARPNHTDVVTS